ncbi:XRE family transcriptional regulator [Lactobacillus sp. ESL0233]|uniref:helix-turn-helix domain-containing protein n=1 Tax=Lactobacillus sp. ESL0233 TaxID=2069354 RepID=UPI000EFA4B57|nr:helix-turn-helix transcriptional regulator [Lactobacillus sp. ESL0233]RMC41723.1 XRE family transcriptional regulator [Lactobacillus sp. ESL0233]
MHRLKELRKQQGLTQTELGHAIGLHDNTLCQYETGKRNPKPEIWQKLADFYGVSVPYLQGYEQPTPHNRLKELRQERGLSQEDLAKGTGITQQAISLYELGLREPSSAIWQQLSVYFGQPVSYLRGEIDINKIQKILQTMLLVNCTVGSLDSFNQGEFADCDRETKKFLALNCLILLIHQELNINPHDQFEAVVNKTTELMNLTNQEKIAFVNRNMKCANNSNKKRDINIANELLNFYDNL